MSGPALERATAFAPASVGNVAIGFDILGFAIDTLGDRVTVSRSAAPGVEVTAVRGVAGELPREARDNTAGRALLAEALRGLLTHGAHAERITLLMLANALKSPRR